MDTRTAPHPNQRSFKNAGFARERALRRASKKHSSFVVKTIANMNEGERKEILALLKNQGDTGNGGKQTKNEEEQQRRKTDDGGQPTSEIEEHNASLRHRKKEDEAHSISIIEKNLFEQVLGLTSEDQKHIIASRRSSVWLEFNSTPGDERDHESFQSSDLYNSQFDSQFKPDEMRCLALVAHNHMKPAMKAFVMANSETLKKFRLTGTKTTITMLKSVFQGDPNVVYGPSFQSGPLGGDAEICSLMCQKDLGGIIFFVDPLSAHPHQADIDSLLRLANVHNLMVAPNPTSAFGMCFLLKCALKKGRKDMLVSFFKTLQSPGVASYKQTQEEEVAKNTSIKKRVSVIM